MQFQDLRDIKDSPNSPFLRRREHEYIAEGIIYPKRAESPSKREFDALLPVLSGISQRHQRLERYEQALHKDPYHLTHKL